MFDVCVDILLQRHVYRKCVRDLSPTDARVDLCASVTTELGSGAVCAGEPLEPIANKL